MDFDLLRDGEQFSNYLGHYQDESELDRMHNFSADRIYHWNMDSDIQISGDLEVIPVSSNFCEIRDTNNGNVNINLQQIMNGWQQLIDIEPDPPGDISEEINDLFTDTNDKDDILNFSDPKTFDITAYLKDDPLHVSPEKHTKKLRAGIKKIDMKAQRYILDEDDEVDVETVSECGDPSPILEAGDLNSLLEQFEASEIPDLTLPEVFLETQALPTVELQNIESINKIRNNLLEHNHIECKPVVKIKQEYKETTDIIIKQEICSDVPKSNVKIEPDLPEGNFQPSIHNLSQTMIKDNDNVKSEPDENDKTIKVKVENMNYLIQDDDEPSINSNKNNTSKNKDKLIESKIIPIPSDLKSSNMISNICVNNFSNSLTRPSLIARTMDKNKQIINGLPQELIKRIKESGKRKCISVIEPIVPNKKQRTSRTIEPLVSTTQTNSSTFIVPNTVQLDHDYCSHTNVRSKNDKKKDSGFESAEEEERTVVEKQPMVKNADGKLMVSLLKVNTIREEKTSKKRKLNLEEYKKRREGVWKSQSNSQNNSPFNSTCNSPLLEDEEVRRKKHQEKLMRMAMEILRTPTKTEKKLEVPQVIEVPKVAQIPPDMEMKTLVSIGVNTQMKRKKNVDPLAPVEQLEQIKPVLQKISDKINSSSLITSLIENIPKVMNSCCSDESKTEPSKMEHGEDKTIVFLPKNRTTVETKDAMTQTNISLIQQTKASRYRRRRNSSTSSSSSSDSQDSRASTSIERDRRRSITSGGSSESIKSSRSSRSSTSSYSSRSYSRSRSRSMSPGFSTSKERERERLREVEERRVIYVGRLSNNVTRENLRKRFSRFGTITNISLHARQHGDKYGFVTFANKLDAYQAIEHGNDDPYYPKYDLSFGGRRIFCQTSYSDLDNMRDDVGYYMGPRTEDSFDNLLKEMQEKLRRRKV